eukprot:scaffold100146_cov21-Tisochrysis_lutea.AAC.1
MDVDAKPMDGDLMGATDRCAGVGGKGPPPFQHLTDIEVAEEAITCTKVFAQAWQEHRDAACAARCYEVIQFWGLFSEHEHVSNHVRATAQACGCGSAGSLVEPVASKGWGSRSWATGSQARYCIVLPMSPYMFGGSVSVDFMLRYGGVGDLLQVCFLMTIDVNQPQRGVCNAR